MKLLKETYKTAEGAYKRSAFENGVASFEFTTGIKARLYRYRAELHDGLYRVARYTPEELLALDAAANSIACAAANGA